ncbi:MAG: hypothetical protein M1150_04125 [Patescibacteria group bacterium]|nr:hypothetical protein [Patescibacteria group bacterium]
MKKVARILKVSFFSSLITTLLFSLTVIFSFPASASPSLKVNYQGRLKDSVGNFQNGTFNFNFKICSNNNSLASCAPVWAQAMSNVQVNNGVFNVALDINPASVNYFNSKEYYLGINVNGGPWMTADGTNLPLLTSSAMSVTSSYLAGAAANSNVLGDLSLSSPSPSTGIISFTKTNAGDPSIVGSWRIKTWNNSSDYGLGINGGTQWYSAWNNHAWYSDSSGSYVQTMLLGPTGMLTVRDKVKIQGASNGWGDTVINGRVWSASSNIHLSPPGGFGVYINSDYREAGGGGGNTNLYVNGDVISSSRVRAGTTPFNDDNIFNGPTTTGLRVSDRLLYVGPSTANLPQGNLTSSDAWAAFGTDWGSMPSSNRKYGAIGVGTVAGIQGKCDYGDIFGLGWCWGALGYNDGTNYIGVYGKSGNPGYAGYFEGGVKTVGSLTVTGKLGTSGFAADSGYPSGWGGGIHTWDIYAEGGFGAGTNGSVKAWFNRNGDANFSGTLTATIKNFEITHPLDPSKKLVHSVLEGPEAAVFYRGEAKLVNGEATVTLPNYFEALTREEGRTVLLTPKFEADNETISSLAASIVSNGKFKVRAVDHANPSQKFYWEVKAVRNDIPPLQVEKP